MRDTETVLFWFIHSFCAPQLRQPHRPCKHSFLCRTDRGEVVGRDAGPLGPCCTPLFRCPNKQIWQLNFISFFEPSLPVELKPGDVNSCVAQIWVTFQQQQQIRIIVKYNHLDSGDADPLILLFSIECIRKLQKYYFVSSCWLFAAQNVWPLARLPRERHPAPPHRVGTFKQAALLLLHFFPQCHSLFLVTFLC